VSRRHVLALDLKDEPGVIEEYTRQHRAVWPEVLASLRRIGVLDMDIYLLGRRLTMVLETEDGFDLETGFAPHRADPRCAEWEDLMKGLQERVPGARPGEWWAVMDPVFHLGPGPGA
jgi:L-rhamnose mutarotase